VSPHQPVLLRTSVVGSHADLAFGGGGDPNDESDHHGHGDVIYPADIGTNPADDGLHRAGGVIGSKNCPQGEGEDNQRGDNQDLPVNLGPAAIRNRGAILEHLCTRFGWTLVFAYHVHIAALASDEIFHIICRFVSFVSRKAVVMRLSHAYTLFFHVRLFKFLSHARKSHSPVRRRGSEAQACERGYVNAFSNLW